MDTDYTTINIDGTDYYVLDSYVQYLKYIDGHLVNLSNQSFTLKSSFADETYYPYIQCSSNSICRYYANRNSSYTLVSSTYTYNGDMLKVVKPDYIIMICLLFLVGIRLIWKK